MSPGVTGPAADGSARGHLLNIRTSCIMVDLVWGREEKSSRQSLKRKWGEMKLGSCVGGVFVFNW